MAAPIYGKLALGLLFMFAVLAAMQAAPRRARKGIIAFFTFLGGLYFATGVLLADEPEDERQIR